MDLQLVDRRAVVAGGSSGIGLAISRRLLEEGALVLVAGRDANRVAACVGELGSTATDGVFGHVVDTRHQGSVDRLSAYVTELWGGVDILVNAAAGPFDQAMPRHLTDVTDDRSWLDLEAKPIGYARTAHAFAPGMVERGWGRIVNIGGLGARLTGSIMGTIRNVSVAALTKNLAEELGPHGVNVTVVHPGPTVVDGRATTGPQAAPVAGKNALGRPVTAEEVADVVAFLASPRSVAINGDAVACGGGHLSSVYY